MTDIVFSILCLFFVHAAFGGVAGYMTGRAVIDPETRGGWSVVFALLGPGGFVAALGLMLADIGRRRAECQHVLQARAEDVARRKHEIEVAALDEELHEVRHLGRGST